MEEDTPQQEHEKPRFLLLPEGCKDLIDALRLHQQEGEAPALAYPHVLSSAANPPQELPSSVTLPDPISIRDLAAILHLEPFKIVHSLIQVKIFASPDTEIDFTIASAICSHYGVAAIKAAL